MNHMDLCSDASTGQNFPQFAAFGPGSLEMHLNACQASLGRRHPPARSSRLRQAAKRATFPWINRQIISAADTGNLELLLQVVSTLVHEMNLVNLSTALHRLAKLSAGDPEAQEVLQGHPTLGELLPAMNAALVRAEMGSADPRCQATSNSIWSLATMQVAYPPLLHTVAAFSERRIRDFKPFELSTVLWAFAKLASVDHVAVECSTRLFELSSVHIREHAGQFSFRCLVMTAWAFANARHFHEDLFHCIAQHMLPMVNTANCQELANAAWSFSTAGVYHEELFAEFAREALRKLSDFKPQELSNLLWSYAVCGNFHVALFECGAQEAQRLDMQPQHISNLLWAYSRLQPHHRITRTTLLALLPRCLHLLSSFKPQELASVLLATAKCFQGTKHQGSELTQSATAAVPAEVTDFFLAATPVALSRLADYSNQSLANVATAFIAMQAGSDTDLYPAIAREAMSRAETLEPSALLLLLRNLPRAPHGVWVHGAVRVLFSSAATRAHDFQDNEKQILSRICCNLLNLQRDSVFTSEELCGMCQSLAELGSWAGTEIAGNLDDEEDELTNSPHCSELGSERHMGPMPGLADGSVLPLVKVQRPDQKEEDELSAQSTVDLREVTADESGSGDSSDNGAPGPVNPRSCRDWQAPVKVTVRRTFLELDEGDNDQDEILTAKTLPPPLEFLPREMCTAKFDAYRADYRRFRSG
eukprot:CAMPEP_0178388674 /NCGR_PEP_ID=MMETSP0689_2-20121128/9717_1 /TAXON_ID=160604 /ORGANISM="Amphidinium massartii, Strain CS-259" /LENGTH=704 /DNA_ID=CAMNT_0020009089 /DNA_START=174 /DNA_END=2285 /DNA_ORIENTATION=-